DLDEATEATLDERVLRDEGFFEAIELVEDDIVDEYVREKTPPEQRRAIEAFLSTPERQRHVQLLQALAVGPERPGALTASGPTACAAAAGGATKNLQWSSWALLAAAASLVIAVGASLYLGVQASRLRADLMAEVRPQTEQLRALEGRLKELSPPPLSL